jgi:hypothetical protein
MSQQYMVWTNPAQAPIQSALHDPPTRKTEEILTALEVWKQIFPERMP